MESILDAVFARQDQLITRRQALGCLSEEQLRHRLGRHWPVVLPGIYASSTGPLVWRQRLRAALLHAGPDALLNDATALRAYRLPYLPPDPRVRVLVPEQVQRTSKDFVVIRRTCRPPEPVLVDGLPTVPVHRAICEFVARHSDARDAFAVAAAAVQLRRTSVADLDKEVWLGPARGRARLRRMIEPLLAGVRSAPENDFRELVLRRRGYPSRCGTA
jgi:hypothetical protein